MTALAPARTARLSVFGIALAVAGVIYLLLVNPERDRAAPAD